MHVVIWLTAIIIGFLHEVFWFPVWHWTCMSLFVSHFVTCPTCLDLNIQIIGFQCGTMSCYTLHMHLFGSKGIFQDYFIILKSNPCYRNPTAPYHYFKSNLWQSEQSNILFVFVYDYSQTCIAASTQSTDDEEVKADSGRTCKLFFLSIARHLKHYKLTSCQDILIFLIHQSNLLLRIYQKVTMKYK